MIDEHGHGTHVAGIIGAARNGQFMHGVAFDVNLTVLRYLGADNAAPDEPEAVEFLINYALDRDVRIINGSYGIGEAIPGDGTPADIDAAFGAGYARAFRRAASLGAVMIFSTGNESQANPGFPAGLPLIFPELTPTWIAVTAVGSDGLLASYANRCGAAAQWCMAAPGGMWPCRERRSTTP